jgi:hypothetical protein
MLAVSEVKRLFLCVVVIDLDHITAPSFLKGCVRLGGKTAWLLARLGKFKLYVQYQP